MTAALLVLLALAVLGAVLRPFGAPALVGPVACSLIAMASGLTSPTAAGHYLRPLVDPLAFLLAAIPLAVLLDRLGYFAELASLLSGRDRVVGRVVGGLWILASATVAVLNLDAAVVLLTPLYVTVARRRGLSPRYIGFQPVILALLASSFLPVSNLTNLIAVARLGVGPLSFVEHLALPGAVACVAGYGLYRTPAVARLADGTVVSRTFGEPGDEGGGALDDPVPGGRRALLVGSAVVGLVLVGFLVGPSFGIREWEVAVGADLVLMPIVRYVPLRQLPWGTALVAAGLGILAGAAVHGLPLAGLFHGSGPLADLRIASASAAGANVVNNLPALLVSLPFVGGHHACNLWPTLAGVNFGPSLLITGSLASLLWAESMRNLGVPVHGLQFFKVGLRVGLPAAATALAVLVVMAPVLGC